MLVWQFLPQYRLVVHDKWCYRELGSGFVFLAWLWLIMFIGTSFSVIHVRFVEVGDLFSLIWAFLIVDVCDNKTFLLCCLFSSSFVFFGVRIVIIRVTLVVCFVSPVFLNGSSSNMSVIIRWCLCGSRVFLFRLLWSCCYDIKLIRCFVVCCMCTLSGGEVCLRIVCRFVLLQHTNTCGVTYLIGPSSPRVMMVQSCR